MAFIGYNNSWKSEFDNIVSSKDRIQDVYFNQLKLKVSGAHKRDEKKQQNLNLLITSL